MKPSAWEVLYLSTGNGAGLLGEGGGVGRGGVDGLEDVYLGRGGQCDANRCN